MDNKEALSFLFDISKEVRHFYESPVVFLTKSDFSETVFKVLCDVHTLLIEGKNKDALMDIIIDFHLNWLRSVNEIESIKKRVYEVPKEEIYEAISFTIDAISNRVKYYQKFMEKNRSKLQDEDHLKLNADIEIVEDMHKEVTKFILDKLRWFRISCTADDLIIKIKELIDQLLQWLDRIYDGLALTLSKYTNFNLPQLTGDLTKTLQQIVDEIHVSQSSSALKLLNDLKQKGKELGTMIHCTVGHDLEINKVVEKINILEDRISRLENEQSSAVMALKHKKQYLENRLASLENLKITLKQIHQMADISLEDLKDEEICACEDFYQLMIFNHELPQPDRERLVTELCYLWDLAIRGERSHKSIISILSAADIKEEFTDELGTYYIDEHSRKIYKKLDDETRYQPNENKKLVPLSDDIEHVYYYDECGRYFVDFKSRQRIYKAHGTASEYMMDSSGVLLKIKEVRDGITYYFDNYGRYYINDEGQHIYRDEDSNSEFVNDGMGNLVRIRDNFDFFKSCPDDICVTEDSKYLKQSVGKALRQCIAEVVLRQPLDPIKYLSNRLIKYRQNIELRDKNAREKEEMYAERAVKIAEERAEMERAAMNAAVLTQGGSEASYDSNLMKYTSMHPDDTTSVTVTTTK